MGLIGVSQIPGRVLFARLHAEPWNVFALIGLGVAVVVAFDSTAAVLIGLVLLGMGNGMATLSRATAIADLYGAAAYGTIASVAGGVNTAARAAGPFLAAVYATVAGYTGLLWTLVALAVVAALLARLVHNDDVAGLRGSGRVQAPSRSSATRASWIPSAADCGRTTTSSRTPCGS